MMWNKVLQVQLVCNSSLSLHATNTYYSADTSKPGKAVLKFYLHSSFKLDTEVGLQ